LVYACVFTLAQILRQRESLGDVEKWLHNFGRCGRWIGCLTAGTVVLANQERR